MVACPENQQHTLCCKGQCFPTGEKIFSLSMHWGLHKMVTSLETTILKCNFRGGNWHIFIQIPLEYVPQTLIDDTSASVQVMAWCHQAPSHNLNWCWPTSMKRHKEWNLQATSGFPTQRPVMMLPFCCCWCHPAHSWAAFSTNRSMIPLFVVF